MEFALDKKKSIFSQIFYLKEEKHCWEKNTDHDIFPVFTKIIAIRLINYFVAREAAGCKIALKCQSC